MSTAGRYNVEMQVRRYNAWGARSAFYLSRMLSQQLDNGSDYSRLKPAIGIHLLDFDLYQEPEHQQQATWCFEMRDSQQPQVLLGHELQLNLVELKKADRLGRPGSLGPLRAWITFFEHWQDGPVKMALSTIKQLGADEETRRLAFVSERAARDEATLLKEYREEGREEGIVLDMEKGALENSRSMLTELLTPVLENCPCLSSNV